MDVGLLIRVTYQSVDKWLPQLSTFHHPIDQVGSIQFNADTLEYLTLTVQG